MSIADLYQYCFVIFGLGLRLKLKIKECVKFVPCIRPIRWGSGELQSCRTRGSLVILSAISVFPERCDFESINSFYFPVLIRKRMLAKSRLNIWWLWVVSGTMLLHMTTNTNLVVVSVARVAGDGEVLEQVNAVIFIISTQSSFQKSLPVVVIPARHKEAEASH